jgi:hypothetical protein
MPAVSDLSKVCNKCGEWVFYDNGDVTYHCLCSNNHWIFETEYIVASL